MSKNNVDQINRVGGLTKACLGLKVRIAGVEGKLHCFHTPIEPGGLYKATVGHTPIEVPPDATVEYLEEWDAN